MSVEKAKKIVDKIGTGNATINTTLSKIGSGSSDKAKRIVDKFK